MRGKPNGVLYELRRKDVIQFLLYVGHILMNIGKRPTHVVELAGKRYVEVAHGFFAATIGFWLEKSHRKLTSGEDSTPWG
jgi:hypothetical protein